MSKGIVRHKGKHMVKITEEIEQLQDEYKFIIEQDLKHTNIVHIIFKDGRQYKMQHPGFWVLHELLTGTDNISHILLVEGIKYIFSENDKKFWFEVFIYGGKQGTGIDVIQWAKKAEHLGAGEILLTSIDKDGTKDGYDILLTKLIVDSVSIPVIASGGCGKPSDMVDVLRESNVDAVLAASIFHYETHGVKGVKKYLKEKEISVRL